MTSVFTSSHESISRPGCRRLRHRVSGTALLAAVLAAGLTLTATGTAHAGNDVPLGTSAAFAVLAGAGGISKTGPSTMIGNIGVDSGGAISGTGTITPPGAQYVNDTVSLGAQNDLIVAYDYLEQAGPVTPPTIASGQVGGKTFGPGIHNSGAFDIDLTGEVILDGGGNPDAVFIFQSPAGLTTAPASVVTLIGQAQACNVFWQVTSSATFDTTTMFKGTIVALTSISLATGAQVEGRVLARNGAVTLDSNTIRTPTCVAGSGGSSGSAGSGGAAGASGASTQITRVPVGSVDTGDGSLGPAARLWSRSTGLPSA